MREILFRGKRIDGGEWVYGLLCRVGNTYANIVEKSTEVMCTVLTNTIGQCTGLIDKNGKKIFEGDFVTLDGNGNYLVYEYNGVLCVDYETPDYDCTAIGFLKADCVEIEVIGNIHDNPELLEVGK